MFLCLYYIYIYIYSLHDIQIKKTMIIYILLVIMSITHAQKWDKVYTAKCTTGKMVFTDLRFTPCWEMNEQISKGTCVAEGLCSWERIYEYRCRLYWENNRQYLYKCDDNVRRDIKIIPNSFKDTFELCGGGDLETFLRKQSKAGAKFRGQFKRSSIDQKYYWQQFGWQVKTRSWDKILQTASHLNVNACRKVSEADEDILIILGHPGSRRRYSGNVLAIRISDDVIPIGLDGAHGNTDSGTGIQAINVFARSKAFMAIIPSFFKDSTKVFDFCQRSRKITDNAHSLESPFIHALAGFADAFEYLSFIELHRCGKCGAIRIGRGVSGKESTETSFIRAFITSAEKHIIPTLSKSAKSRKFYATIFPSALSSIGSTWFETSKEKSFFSRTSVNGKLLQGVKNVCSVEASAKDDSSRFIHVEQVRISFNTYILTEFIARWVFDKSF